MISLGIGRDISPGHESSQYKLFILQLYKVPRTDRIHTTLLQEGFGILLDLLTKVFGPSIALRHVLQVERLPR
jgi:hypothetical protein